MPKVINESHYGYVYSYSLCCCARNVSNTHTCMCTHTHALDQPPSSMWTFVSPFHPWSLWVTGAKFCIAGCPSVNLILSVSPDHSQGKSHRFHYASSQIKFKPGIERVHALVDISRLALCCHSSETRAPIANLRNSAQLDGTRYHSPKLHPGPCSGVGMWRGTVWQTDTDGHDQHTFHLGYVSHKTAITNIHFFLAAPHAKCNIILIT